MKDKNLFIFNIDKDFENAITSAAELFFTGKVFIYPTDTIYGIGGNPFNADVVKRIINIKGRDESRQFIWLVADVENLLNYIDIDFEVHLEFLKKIWPAPVSVVLKLNSRSSEIVGFKNAAFRVTDNDFCNKLLNEIRLPLISTSVNRSGKPALNDYSAIMNEFVAGIDGFFYSERKTLPVASTIIDLSGDSPVLIREGAIKFVELLSKFN